jgi:NADH:ubiquinone oxidoreductase subunit H
MLLMFFLCEYLHLIISSLHFCIFFLGGWISLSMFSFALPFFNSFHSSFYYFIFFK